MKLTTTDVIGKWAGHITPAQHDNIDRLVATANALIEVMVSDGVMFPVNPMTGSIVGGETLGGFRPQNCPIGAPNSAHKMGMAVDLYDPNNAIDKWLWNHRSTLNTSGLWFEHPDATPRWSHWSIRPPRSGARFFRP